MVRQAMMAIGMLVLFETSPAEAGGCDISNYRTGLDYPEVTANMVVSHDTTCGTQIKSRLQPGVQKTYHSFVFTVKPSHGIAGKTTGFIWAYKPTAGYIGADRFQFEIFFDENGVPGRTKVDVEVSIVDG